MRMQKRRAVEEDPPIKKDDLIVIAGAGGFIAGNLVLYFAKKGFTNIRAVDKKPLYAWYLRIPGAQNLCLDVSQEDNCKRVCETIGPNNPGWTESPPARRTMTLCDPKPTQTP